ncbi:hypothetical protein KAK06_00845 [Ideonella sp. 4Y11]|uniref:Uncharacterized protein n=1 Tax=Ideonella aquatica TaxID=2824119 RepID=A0A941BHC0_9BURK|nr:hypothetical protein [Ideonella aquatica]MBQ0957492.1 hypothetical protein [Ideonella aquatica]
MTHALQIDLLNLRWRGDRDEASRRLSDWRAQWAALDGEALARRWVDDEAWLLIRRLPISLRWRGDPSDHEAGAAFEQALEQAIAQAVARGDADVLRFAQRRAALADLLMRAAQRDPSRHWAWQRMGWLPREDLDPDEVLQRGLAALAAEPALAWPVLRRLLAGEARCASFSALLRVLSPQDWQRWLVLAPPSAPWASLVSEAVPAAVSAAERSLTPVAETAAARELRQWAAHRPLLRERHAALLGALLAALRHEGRARTPAQARADWQAALIDLMPAAPGREPHPAPLAMPEVDRPATRSAARRPDTSTSPPAEPSDAPPRLTAPGPELPEPAQRLATAHGGLLFWLSRAVAAGLTRLPAEAPLPSYLLALGRALGVPDKDPVQAAFCGGLRPDDEPDDVLHALANEQAVAWEAWLAQAAPDLPAPRVAAVCRRAGWLLIEPGWIELHLPLDSVDLRVRRLGLDLDPGWITPLACVLRIRYDA